MLSWVTSTASQNWLLYSISCDIPVLMVTRGYPIAGWILQDYVMIGLYGSVWILNIQYTEVNHIRKVIKVVLRKLLCYIWTSTNNCYGFKWNFSGMLKNNFQDTLLILVHSVTRGDNKEIINKYFHHYLNKVQKINSAGNGSFQQWFQGVLFELCECNEVPVYLATLAWSLLATSR